jgi:hypothetical protein
VVRNTQENLDLIDALIASGVQGGPVQVEIEAKFIEITQSNLKELSFDWLIGQANWPSSSSSVFVSGGTPGTSAGVNPADFPFVAPGGTPVGQFPLTAGNRSGALALAQMRLTRCSLARWGPHSLPQGSQRFPVSLRIRSFKW